MILFLIILNKMLKKLKGKIIEIKNNYIVLDVHDLGFELNVSNPKFYKINQIYDLYIYDYLSENNIILFGFSTYDDYEFFNLIISLDGYGPKKSLNILKNISFNDFKKLVISKNVNELRKICGISTNAEFFISKLFNKISKSFFNNKNIKNTYDTLLNLGYKDEQIKNILINCDLSLTEEELIKFCIKGLKYE